MPLRGEPGLPRLLRRSMSSLPEASKGSAMLVAARVLP